MKPKAIFMGKKEPKERVYGKETIEKLKEKLDFLPDFYTKDLIRNTDDHGELHNVEYIFST